MGCTYICEGYHIFTDVDPGDGRSCVIPKCQKSYCTQESIIKTAQEDPSLIHQVVAPAGSTQIFWGDTTKLDRQHSQQRTIIISGCQPWNFSTGTDREFAADFEDQIPQEQKRLIFGSDLDPRMRRPTLEMEVGTGDLGEYLDDFSLVDSSPKSYENNVLTRSRLGATPSWKSDVQP